MKITRSKNVRSEIREKINKALSSKPTANYMASKGLTPEEINQMYGPPRKASKTGKNMRTRGRGALNPNRPLRQPMTTFDPPKYDEFSAPQWFQSLGNVDVSIIVPMFNSKSQIREQIASWDIEDGVSKEIIYIDDHCPQHSFEEVISSWNDKKSKWDRPIGKIIINSENGGFGFSCNVGSKFASGKYLIFLNADCAVTSNWIMPMINLIESNPVIGIVGNLQIRKNSKIIESAGSEWNGSSFEHIGSRMYKGARIDRPFTLDNMPNDLLEPGERQMVTGSCFLITKELFNMVGKFDTEYRIGYWEDSDLNMKVRTLGYKVYYQPKSIIYHTPGHAQVGHNGFINQNKNKFFKDWVDNGVVDTLNRKTHKSTQAVKLGESRLPPPPLKSEKPVNIIVYTAITTGYDTLLDNQNKEGATFVAFIEDASVKSQMWDIRRMQKECSDPNRNAKIYKILSHKYFPDCDYSLWIDGNVRLLQPIQRIIDTFMENYDMVLFKHPERTCLYAEAETCATRSLDDPNIIARQINRYRQENYPQNVGLCECTILLRRHSPLVKKFNEAWWEEVCNGSKRDQISFPYIAKKVGLRHCHFPGNLRVGTFMFFKTTSHRRK